MRKIALLLAASCMIASAPAQACDLDDVIGWTIVTKKTAISYIEDGEEEDGYIGCTYDRILVFSDGTGAACATYSYDYAYRPDAYIFSNGYRLKACIDDEIVDLRPLR